MIERLRRIVDVFAARGVGVAFETGQENAENLEVVMRDMGRPTLGVNFDPANMILYGMGEPVPALRGLAPWVRQVHIKDAKPASKAGVWGEEVVAGTGAVDWARFFGFVREMLPRVCLLVEREAGVRRVEDVRAAVEMVESYLGAGDG
jgi:sugar phosphate isomerase/epimerase